MANEDELLNAYESPQNQHENGTVGTLEYLLTVQASAVFHSVGPRLAIHKLGRHDFHRGIVVLDQYCMGKFSF